MPNSIFSIGQKVVPISYLINTEWEPCREKAVKLVNEGGMTVEKAFKLSAEESTSWQTFYRHIDPNTIFVTVKDRYTMQSLPEDTLATLDEARVLLNVPPYNKAAGNLTRADLGLPARPATEARNTKKPEPKQ